VPTEDWRPVADCPESIRNAAELSVSVIPVALPEELRVAGDSTRQSPLVARRLMLSVIPQSHTSSLRITDSSVDITIVGGTFAPWATLKDGAPLRSPGHGQRASSEGPDRVAELSRAIEIIPGRVRIAPIQRDALRAITLTFEVMITPGGVPIDGSTVVTSALWGNDLQAMRPDDVKVDLMPIRIPSIYDVVDGDVTVRYVATTSQDATQRYACTMDQTITLVGAQSARPPLWDLGVTQQGGTRSRWLAIFNPETGAMRAVFTSPSQADGFARWAREVNARSVGRFTLGTFAPDPEVRGRSGLPRDMLITKSFRPISAEEISELRSGAIGEP
jgi:hypothetical protein